jgi:hypothetical protein
MAGREPDYDDWFDEPEPAPDRRRRGSRGGNGNGWTIPTRSRRDEPMVIAGVTVTTRALVVAGVSLVALVIAILAAAGAFSGGGTKATSTLPTTPATVTAPTSTTPLTTTPTTSATTAPTTTLKPGDTGSQVTTLQKELTALGHSPGKADGVYGPATEQAVKDFQTAKGLTADGIVGPKTLAALQQAAGG